VTTSNTRSFKKTRSPLRGTRIVLDSMPPVSHTLEAIATPVEIKRHHYPEVWHL
jgi:hypothetical protein